MFKKVSARSLCRAGVIAALYACMSFLLPSLTFGIIQFRLSEALTVLPLFFVESVPALFIGCLIVNIFSGSVYDVAIGSLATLLAAICTYIAGKLIKNKVVKFLVGMIFPVVFNAFAVPLVFLLSGTATHAYMTEVLIIGAEELGVVAVFGGVLYFAADRFFSKKNVAKSAEIETSAEGAGKVAKK